MKTEMYQILCRRLTFSLLSWLSLIVCCWYGSAYAPLFAQQNTFLPLSKNTVWLYSHTHVSQGWQNVRMGIGSFQRYDFSYSKKGYFYVKILGDTTLPGVLTPCAVRFQPPRYVDTQDPFNTQDPLNLGAGTTIQYSAQDVYYQYDDLQTGLIPIFSALTKYYAPFSMYPGHSISSDSNNYIFSYSTETRDNESRSSSGKSATISRGKGLSHSNQSSSRSYSTSRGDAGESTENEEIKLIGMIVDGKIYGDSLIQFLDTETNQFIKFKVSAPKEITATVNEILEIPITFSPPKNTALIGQNLTVNLSFNASVLEPIEDTPRGNVVAGIRTIPINLQIMRTDSDTVKKLKFRCAISNDTATILRLDSLKFSTPQPILIDLQSGSAKISGYKLKVSAPKEITATVNEILEIPITFSPPKNTALIGQNLTVNLSFNASVLEPIEDTPKGNVVAGIRTIPINLQIMRTDSDTVKKLKFRCAISNDTTTILRLDSLKFSTPQPVLIDLQSGSVKISGYKKLKVSAPKETTATVNETLEIPITFSPLKNTALIGQNLTVNLSFNASVLEPIEDTPRGNVVAGIRTIPINLQIMRTDSDTVKKLKFRCAIGNDTASILRLDSLKFSTPQPVLIDLQSGSVKISGYNRAGNSPQRFFSKGKNIIVSAYPNPFNNLLNVSLSGETKFANMKLTLFNVHGMEISSVEKATLDGAGQQNIEFAVPDNMPSGVYVLLVQLDGQIQGRVLVMKEP